MNKRIIALATILGISVTSLIDIITNESKDNLEYLKRYLGIYQEEQEETLYNKENFSNDYERQRMLPYSESQIYDRNSTIIGIHKETKSPIIISLKMPYDEYLEYEKTNQEKITDIYYEYDLYPLINISEYLDIEIKDNYNQEEIVKIIIELQKLTKIHKK